MRLYYATWAEVLVPVATDWLDECYRHAIRNHDLTKPFSPIEILEAWRLVVGNGEVERSRIGAGRMLTEGERTCCTLDNWIIVDASGNRTTDFNRPTFARRCQVHFNPKGE